MLTPEFAFPNIRNTNCMSLGRLTRKKINTCREWVRRRNDEWVWRMNNEWVWRMNGKWMRRIGDGWVRCMNNEWVRHMNGQWMQRMIDGWVRRRNGKWMQLGIRRNSSIVQEWRLSRNRTSDTDTERGKQEVRYGHVLWSLEFGVGVLHEFLLINLVGMTHCRTHAGCMQDALQELLQGLTLASQQVG